MPESEQGLFLARSLKFLQENLRRAGPAAGAGYTLIGALALCGGIGYALDSWRGTSPGFLLTGLLLGLVVGFVQLAKIVFRK
jgi:F0F1-type ATP synthase assembly protein I